jgi:hypothetical protein
MIVEDKDGTCIMLSLYNQEKDFESAQKTFPTGIEIGIKNPYIQISYHGTIIMRNDNP